MLQSIGRLFARLFGRSERDRQLNEIIDLARRANAFPDNERLILRLADCYLRAADKPRALSAYWHVVDLYKKRSDWQKSAAILKRIILLSPSETIARFDIAHCFEKLERRREAAQQWEQVGRMLIATNDKEGAIRCFSRAVNLDPSQHQLAAELGRLNPPPAARRPTPQPPPPAPPPPAPPPPVLPVLMPAPSPSVRPNLASLGRAAVRDELSQPVMTALDNPLDGYDLGVDDKATTEYSAEDLSTLLDNDFDADTVAVESLPHFDEEHRPGDTPLDPLSFAP